VQKYGAFGELAKINRIACGSAPDGRSGNESVYEKCLCRTGCSNLWEARSELGYAVVTTPPKSRRSIPQSGDLKRCDDFSNTFQ